MGRYNILHQPTYKSVNKYKCNLITCDRNSDGGFFGYNFDNEYKQSNDFNRRRR